MSKNAGVVAPPPLIFLSFLGLAWLAHHLHPWPLGAPRELRLGLAAVLGGAALPLLLGAVTRFRRAGTEVRPWKPSTAFVCEGPYRFTRNPMYVAMLLLYSALGLLLNTVYWIPLTPPLLAFMNWGVIIREERYLEGLFGADYVAYKARVRRWL